MLQFLGALVMPSRRLNHDVTTLPTGIAQGRFAGVVDALTVDQYRGIASAAGVLPGTVDRVEFSQVC
jgi:hypothetical protein